jgi:hypothetical protein
MKTIDQLVTELEQANLELNRAIDFVALVSERYLLAESVLSDKETFFYESGQVVGSNEQQRKTNLAVLTTSERDQVVKAKIAKFHADKDYEKARRQVYYLQTLIGIAMGTYSEKEEL